MVGLGSSEPSTVSFVIRLTVMLGTQNVHLNLQKSDMHLEICMYIYMYIKCIYIYICIYIYAYASANVYIYIHVYVRIEFLRTEVPSFFMEKHI